MLLTVAYRSLSRLSSALSAKASTLRSCSLNLIDFILLRVGLLSDVHSVARLGLKWFLVQSRLTVGQSVRLIVFVKDISVFDFQGTRHIAEEIQRWA